MKVRIPTDKHDMNTLVTADLFAGAGGLSVGFQQAGYEIAFANDLCPEYAATYQANHPGTRFFQGSVEYLTAKKIFRTTGLSKNDIDVLIGGPPCQGFSINAPHRSIADDRNHLFEQYGRLVFEGLRPKVILMENVPGLISLDHGRFITAIYELFSKAGYRMRHMILCAAHYGVPQERWRLILIGTLLSGEITFPEPTHHAPVRPNFTGARTLTWLPLITNGSRSPSLFDSLLTKHTATQDALSDLPALEIEQGSEEARYTRQPRTSYQRELRANAQVLYNHVAGKLSPQNLERVKHVPPGGSWRDIPHELLPLGMQRARRSDHTRRYGRLDPNGLSGTVLTKCDPHWGTFFHYEQDRTLTVREAARLQSFPDEYRFHGSRVSQYEQVGNAVPPLLAKAIGLHLRKTLFNR